MAWRSFALVATVLLADGSQSARLGNALRRSHTGSCVTLKNHGSHSTVEIEVGEPGQKLDVVADTGSDNLIITSCACVDDDRCEKGTKCFRGTNLSSTFKIKEDPEVVQVTFGSGPVQTVVATDSVSMGGVVAEMKDSLLLMIDQNLDPPMAIEGIMGLGLPKNVSEDALQGADAFSATGFLEAANIDRFSLCFNSGEDGVLRLGGQSSAEPLGSIGHMHWGVGLEGVTVGDQGAGGQKAALCDSASMQSGQTTPCGAIVDSGTTLITAPAAQLEELYAQMCEGWSKCRDRPNKQLNVTEALFAEVATCNTEGLPTLHFHISGAGGAKQTLQLEPNLITLATNLNEDTGEASDCILAFQALEYDTQDNGPVWIFGTPFYYKYTVGYDISTTPPQVSFAEAECEPCGSSRKAQSFMGRHFSARRTLSVPPRAPTFDTSVPM